MSSSEIGRRSHFGRWNARFVCRYAGWILSFIVLLCVAAFPFAKNLKLHANFLELLPAHSASVVNLKELTDLVGGTSYLICVIESPNDAAVEMISKRFAEEAKRFPGVDYVDNRALSPALESRKLLFLKLSSVAQLKQKVIDLIDYYRRKANPFSLQLLEEEPPQIDAGSFELEHKAYRIGGFSNKGRDSFMRIVLVKPNHTVGDFDKSRKLFITAHSTFERIRAEAKFPATLGITGPYATREAEYRTLMSDLRLTGFLTVFLIAGIMFIAFRKIRILIYAYLPLGASIVLTWAFTDLTIGYLNLITAFLVSILLGMGSDYTLHMLVNLEPDISAKKNLYLVVERTYSQLWKPLVSSMLTTAVAFGAMTISGFEGFRHFGIIAGVGIVIAFIVVFYGLPSLVVIGEKYLPSKKRLEKQYQPLSKQKMVIIFIAGLLFTLYSLIQIPHIRFNYDFSTLQANKDNSVLLSKKINAYLGVQLNPVGLMAPTRERADEIVSAINRHIADHPDTIFDFASSLHTHVPRNQEEKIKILAEIDQLIEQKKPLISHLDPQIQKRVQEFRVLLKAQPFDMDHLPKEITRQYEDENRKVSMVWVYPNADILDGKITQHFVRELRSLPLGNDVKIAGDPVIFADVLNQMEKDTPLVLILSFITVVGLLFIHFRRLSHVLWVLAPVAIGFLWTIGMSGTFHLSYNFINMAILPSILGVGIDSGIYIFDHYLTKKEEGFFVSMQRTSKGVILSSLTNIAAFASLAFAQHQGMASMGLLGVFGFLSCLLASVYFVPIAIEFFLTKTKKPL